MVPDVPAESTVVATVIPVVAVLVLVEPELVIRGGSPFPESLIVVMGTVCEWPGSVTVEVAVCVCDTTIASAEPPVPLTA